MDDESLELTLPLFPLNTVLFPGGVLPLRIFEPRYIDMVTACLKRELEFGVCLIKKGKEVGAGAVQTESIGCKARITDWNMEQLGLLQITTIGTERFEVLHTEDGPNGLILAAVRSLDEESAAAIPPQFKACVDLLSRILEQLESSSGDAPEKAPIAKPYQLGDATWVGNRLCEVLPISLAAKQKLMELTDGTVRLSIVHQYLVQQKIV